MMITLVGFSNEGSFDLGVGSLMNLLKSFNIDVDTPNNVGKVEKTFLILSRGVSRADSLALVEDI